jgi:hypothetical protein
VPPRRHARSAAEPETGLVVHAARRIAADERFQHRGLVARNAGAVVLDLGDDLIGLGAQPQDSSALSTRFVTARCNSSPCAPTRWCAGPS